MAIFKKLASGPMAVHELAGTLPVSRPAVSQHLRVLKDAGLVTNSKAGTRRLYQLNPEGIALLRAHFDQVWDQAMSAFQTSVEQAKTGTRDSIHNSRFKFWKRQFASTNGTGRGNGNGDSRLSVCSPNNEKEAR